MRSHRVPLDGLPVDEDPHAAQCARTHSGTHARTHSLILSRTHACKPARTQAHGTHAPRMHTAASIAKASQALQDLILPRENLEMSIENSAHRCSIFRGANSMRSGFQEAANVPAPFDQHSYPVVDVEGRTTGEEAKTQYLTEQKCHCCHCR